MAGLDPGALPGGPLILHVDLDVIDAAELPGLLFPAPGGPSSATVLDAIGRIRATGRLVVLDIACPWHPTLDGRIRQTRERLLAALLGGG